MKWNYKRALPIALLMAGVGVMVWGYPAGIVLFAIGLLTGIEK